MVVLSLLHDYLNIGYCVILDDYYASSWLANALISCDTDCYGTCRKKKGLPKQLWDM